MYPFKLISFGGALINPNISQREMACSLIYIKLLLKFMLIKSGLQ